VQGWKKYQKDGLQRPNIVTAATESYKEEQDPLADFINDCIIFDPNHLTKSNEVYEAYLEWGNNRKEPRLLSRKKFYELIEERGIKSFKKQNVKYLIGIKLYNSHQDSIIIPPTVKDVQHESEDPYDEPF
jgi:putative DNA primase/helicase